MDAGRVWVNGLPAQQVSVTDRGLAYGDGLFETLRIEQGRPVLLEAHLQRLTASAQYLDLRVDMPRLAADFSRFVADAGNAVAKIMVTRGSGGRGYLPPPDATPSVIFSLHDAVAHDPALSRTGIVAAISQLLLGTSPLLAGHKHLNRLEQVLLRQELASSPGAQEALVMDGAGHVVEGVFSNVFWVRDGVLHTPLLDQSGVKGVMRGSVMQHAAASGMDVREGRYCLQDVQAADEVFFCNSLYGIWPVRQLGDQPLPPGPVAAMLHDYWQQLLEAA